MVLWCVRKNMKLDECKLHSFFASQKSKKRRFELRGEGVCEESESDDDREGQN